MYFFSGMIDLGDLQDSPKQNVNLQPICPTVSYEEMSHKCIVGHAAVSY
jgi:hypothetical protein